MLFCPEPDAADGFAEAFAAWGEGVIDVRRDDGMDAAGDEAIPLELPKSFGEHLLADAGDALGKMGEAKLGGGLAEFLDNEESPLVGDAPEYLVDEGQLSGVLSGERSSYSSH